MKSKILRATTAQEQKITLVTLAKIPPIRYLHLTNANICLFGERVGLSSHGKDGNRKSECSSVQLPICANRKDSKFGIEMTKGSQAKDSVREMVEEDKNYGR